MVYLVMKWLMFWVILVSMITGALCWLVEATIGVGVL